MVNTKTPFKKILNKIESLVRNPKLIFIHNLFFKPKQNFNWYF